MNYAVIKQNDIANGPGVRVSLFVSGCRHRCVGCFNSEAWDFDYGKEYSEKTAQEIISMLSPSYVDGFSLLGGEPFEPENIPSLTVLTRKIKEKFPSKSIWCYSGFTFEELISKDEISEKLLENIDVLVDGRFEQDKKDISLIFRGSSNQRIIDVKESLKRREAVLFPGKWQRTFGLSDIYEN